MTSRVRSVADLGWLIPGIIDRWSRYSRHLDAVPLSPDRAERYRQLLNAIIHWRVATVKDPAFQGLLDFATTLGEDARAASAPPEAMIREMEILDLAIRDEIFASSTPSPDVGFLQSALMIAMSAAVRGYGRRELEARSEWDSSLEAIRLTWFDYMKIANPESRSGSPGSAG